MQLLTIQPKATMLEVALHAARVEKHNMDRGNQLPKACGSNCSGDMQAGPKSMKELRAAVGQAAPVVLRRANDVLRVVSEASAGEVRNYDRSHC